MKISEAASAAGLDVSSVRFYERKGLISPERGKDSTYRDYSREDIEKLKKIVLFRKIDMSVEDIRRILTEDADISDILQNQLKRLRSDMEKIESSINLCEKMITDGYLDDEADKYLAYVNEAEEKGRKFPDIMPVLDMISENSGLGSVIGYPIFIRLMANTLCRRLLAVVIVLVMLVFPVAELVISIIRYMNGQSGLLFVVVLVFYCIMLITALLGMAREYKTKGKTT